MLPPAALAGKLAAAPSDAGSGGRLKHATDASLDVQVLARARENELNRAGGLPPSAELCPACRSAHRWAAPFPSPLSSLSHLKPALLPLAGAGISAESGIPTFRGAGGLWRKYDSARLATARAFVQRPSLVWEFYHWRRCVAARCRPNPAHYAMAALEQRLAALGRRLTLVTQNVDRLHQQAGSKAVLELHGSIWDVCRADRGGLKDGSCWEDRRQPLAPALAGRGAPDPDLDAEPDIPTSALPQDGEGRLLRPGVVWFGETLDPAALASAEEAVAGCDLFVTAGTSAVVYPAAGFAEQVAARGVPVAEFNLETSGSSSLCTFAFRGRAAELLPAALGVEAEVRQLHERQDAEAVETQGLGAGAKIDRPP